MKIQDSPLNELFEKDRFWLEKQPNMQPWEKGKEQLAAKLENLVHSTIDAFFEKKQVSYRPVAFLPRLWDCIRYFWKLAAEVVDSEKEKSFTKKISFEEVVQRIVSAKRCDQDSPFVKPNILKSADIAQTPFPDLAYTVFYAKIADSAIRGTDVMTTYYKPYCMGIVQRVIFSPKAKEDDWWGKLEDYLQGLIDSVSDGSHVSDDMTESARVKIYEYRGQSHLKSWLSKVAYNFYIACQKKNKEYSYPTFGDTENESKGMEIADVESLTPEEIAIMREEEGDVMEQLRKRSQSKEYRKDLLKRVIAELPEKEKAILKFYYYDGLKQHEIGAILGIHKGNISKALSRAKKMLADIIGSYQQF